MINLLYGLTLSAHSTELRVGPLVLWLDLRLLHIIRQHLLVHITATNFILSSDETLKDKIKDIETKHVDVEWKNFELISEPGVKRSGVVAQELEKKHPEFVRTDDSEGLKSVAYIDLLIAKIAELRSKIRKSRNIMAVPDTTTFEHYKMLLTTSKPNY